MSNLITANRIKTIILWLAFLALIIFLHAKNCLDSDEGAVLGGAWRLFNGQKIYFDFFEITPPGAYYLINWLWHIFSPTYLAAKLFSIVCLWLVCLGIYAIGKNLNKQFSYQHFDRYVYISILIFIFSSFYWPLIIYHLYSLLFIVWATYFFCNSLSTLQKIDIFASGLMAGISCLFLHNRGLIVVFAFSSFLFFLFIKERKSHWLKYFFLFLLSSALPILLLFANWPASILFQNLIEFPVLHYTEVASVPYTLMLFFILILLLVGLVLQKNYSVKIICLFYLQLLLLISTYSLADHYHITLVLFPLYVLMPIMAGQIKNRSDRLVISLTTIGVTALLIAPTIKLLLTDKLLFTSAVNNKAISYLKANCNESPYIYAGPFLPGVYFETKKTNPTPYDWLITNHHTPEQFSQAAKMLADKRPACAILNYQMVAKYKYTKNNPVDSFIEQNYHLTYKEGDVSIMKINEQ